MEMDWQFKRYVEENLIKELMASDLWKNKLKSDCESKKDVFLAFRKDTISFYYKGGKLFSFDKDGFQTHIKYASVIEKDENLKQDYIRQNQLKNISIIRDFVNGYPRIKENCELYAGEEAKGVSCLYKNSSYLSNDDIVVLDIEVVFRDEDRKKDRIDILLYNKSEQTLYFAEAKHFTNNEIWSNSTPPVIGQIGRYEDEIKRHKLEIIEQYGSYVDNINRIFNTQLKHPLEIKPNVALLIFGFDDAQKKGKRFKELIWDNPEYKNVPIYPKGHPEDINAESIWNATP